MIVRSLFLAPRDDGHNEQEARKAKMSEKRYIRSSENVGVTKSARKYTRASIPPPIRIQSTPSVETSSNTRGPSSGGDWRHRRGPFPRTDAGTFIIIIAYTVVP
jgi:hypothetical protein